MEVVRNPVILRDSLRKDRMKGRTIGFVPTMGALHEGHMSLLRASRVENDIAVASIFVNPAQFGPNEDLSKYPRDIEGDSAKLREAGVDILFCPEAQTIYPEGFSAYVEVEGLSEKLCGAFRPGHFRGVATIVTKLLNIVCPTRAYFGQKDYQQSLIVRRLVKDLNMDIEVVVSPTVREPDGLAMSSRNAYLNAEERKAAASIHRALSLAAGRVKSGIIDIRELKGLIMAELQAETLIAGVDYASAFDPDTLEELRGSIAAGGRALLAAAVRIGSTRLIDNMLIERDYDR